MIEQIINHTIFNLERTLRTIPLIDDVKNNIFGVECYFDIYVVYFVLELFNEQLWFSVHTSSMARPASTNFRVNIEFRGVFDDESGAGVFIDGIHYNELDAMTFLNEIILVGINELVGKVIKNIRINKPLYSNDYINQRLMFVRTLKIVSKALDNSIKNGID